MKINPASKWTSLKVFIPLLHKRLAFGSLFVSFFSFGITHDGMLERQFTAVDLTACFTIYLGTGLYKSTMTTDKGPFICKHLTSKDQSWQIGMLFDVIFNEAFKVISCETKMSDIGI